ncbi:phosphomannomutase/phosphoglucomutase [Streptomyces sp. SID13031]|uniref:phosphomannomutase/phosphoglucomutase n=1 Tax=Streptomyces sp. SID13031 TaxID=2706046 RepID=UPI0013C83ACA|nr:phosphomannomutase/phosphoglucomutase [Streptomyces sp. SID13031]NEA30902.1 phosphomannomutase/phosphoglucomutase [Streptomyces sp. SID13031]
MADVAAIFKAYDVRGVVPDELDEAVARATGAAFVEVLDVLAGPGAVVIGYDMRPSSPGLAAAFAEGVTSTGVDVIDIGLASTDQLYFASGRLQLPGAMFTASHNPAKYNGIKMCRAGASPVGSESGLRDIADLVAKTLIDGLSPVPVPGHVRRKELLTAYADHLNDLVGLTGIRPLKVVVDAGNGMGGHTVPAVFATGPVEILPLYFELDGNFPNHEANPLDPKNLVDLQAKVRETGADLGLAFDGDADRCFVVDEKGDAISPSAITGAVAVRELAKHPGSIVLHNLITSKAVPELIAEHGGVPVRTRVGHSNIKQKMAETDAVFGGEHSAHYYFRDFWRADTGMLAALHVLAALGEQDKPASELFSVYERYVASGELNSQVADAAATVAAIEDTYGDREGITVDHLDGLTIDAGEWWFNVRASNTEPLLRLNVEAGDAATMERVRDEVLALITGAPVEEKN